MKGLFVKDLLLIKNQKRLIIVILFFAVLYPLVGMDITFIYMIGMMGIITAVSTLSYDEFENGNCFLFTLPFTRREYVSEKYLLSIVGVLTGLIIGVAGYLIVYMVRDGVYIFGVKEILLYSFGAFLGFGGSVAVMLPIYFRYGVERGRMPAYIALFVIFGLSSFVMEHVRDAYPESGLAYLLGLPLPTLGVIVFVIDVALVLLSMAVSFRLIEKKEY